MTIGSPEHKCAKIAEVLWRNAATIAVKYSCSGYRERYAFENVLSKTTECIYNTLISGEFSVFGIVINGDIRTTCDRYRAVQLYYEWYSKERDRIFTIAENELRDYHRMHLCRMAVAFYDSVNRCISIRDIDRDGYYLVRDVIHYPTFVGFSHNDRGNVIVSGIREAAEHFAAIEKER